MHGSYGSLSGPPLCGHRWTGRGIDSILGQVRLPGARRIPLEKSPKAFILMGDWCGVRHRMKRKQERVTVRPPPVREEKMGKQENSFHGNVCAYMTFRLMGDTFCFLEL
jgi:hypothetical protein